MKKHIGWLTLVLLLGLAGRYLALADTYYVAANGDDSNFGTESFPWRTLDRVSYAEEIDYGDTVYFRGGDMWRGQLRPPDGEPSLPNVFTAYHSEEGMPQFRNSIDLASVPWVPNGTNIWEPYTGFSSDLLLHANPSFNGANGWWTWAHPDSAAATGSYSTDNPHTAPGCYHVHCTNNGVRGSHIQFYNNENYFTVQNSSYYRLQFWARASQSMYIHTGLAADYIDSLVSISPWGDPLRMITTDWTLQTFVIRATRSCSMTRINFWLGGNTNMPDNSDLYIDDLTLQEFDGAIVEYEIGNIIFDNGQCGVKVIGDTTLDSDLEFLYDETVPTVRLYSATNPTTRFTQIECALDGNVIAMDSLSHDIVIDGIEVRYGGRNGIQASYCSNITVLNCKVSYVGGARFEDMHSGRVRLGNGVEFYGSCDSVVVRGCTINQVYDAGLTHQMKHGPAIQRRVYFQNNVVSNCEYSYEYFCRNPGSVVSGVHIENNTCLYAGQGWGHNQRPDGPRGRQVEIWRDSSAISNFHIRNNIFYNSAQFAIHRQDSCWHGDSIRIDYNCWYMDNGFHAEIDNIPLNDFAQYQQNTGYDQSSLLADPGFENIGQNNYHLTAGSVCINAGDPLSPPDPDGTRNDIGRFYFPTFLTVSVPNGGEDWQVSQPHEIVWISNPSIGNVQIHLYQGNPPHGSYLLTIAANDLNDGLLTWTIPNTLQPDTNYYVGISEYGNNGHSDFSNVPFTISSPSLGYVQGLVKNSNNQPLDLVTVSIPSLNRQTMTDAKGNYRLNAIPPGQYLLTASKSDYSVNSTNIAVGAGSVTNVDLVLIQSVDVTIELSDETGAPVIDANITVRDSTGAIAASSNDGSGSRIMRTEPGSFLFKLLPGRYRVAVDAALLVTRVVEFYIGPSSITIPIIMNEAQFTTPTHVFLIRGIKSFPIIPSIPCGLDDGAGVWQDFISQFNERYPGSSVIKYHLVAINPTGALDDNTRCLTQAVDESATEPNAKIILVGHSMGGLIARSYVANGNREVERIFTIDTPHAGSWAATGGDMWANSCYYERFTRPLWMLLCWSPNHPAFQELNPVHMQGWNEDIHDREQSKSTEYVLISSSSDLSGEGDVAVNLHSQRGEYGDGQDIFADFMSRVAKPNTHQCSVIRCGGLVDRFVCHNCAPSNDNIINFILNSLNTPIEELRNAPTLKSSEASLEPVNILLHSEMILGGDSLLVSIALPSTGIFQCHVFGMPIGSQWSLISPTFEILDDSADFSDHDGSFELGLDSSNFSVALQNPQMGTWILRILTGNGDSSTVVVQALASMPVLLDPIIPKVALSLEDSILLAAHVTAVPGVSIDSITVVITGNTTTYLLNDQGINGDVTSGDNLWCIILNSASPAGVYPVTLTAFAHAGSEQYRVQSSYEFVVEQPIAHINQSVTWQTMDADSNELFERLNVSVAVTVDSSAELSLAGTLVGPEGEFITAVQSEDSLSAGSHLIQLSFDGKHISDARINGPFILKEVRLEHIYSGGSVTIAYFDSLAISPTYSFSQFEGRPVTVQNVGAVRVGSQIEVFWTPHSDPDIAYFKLYYDTDGQAPYTGTGLVEGNSPVNAGTSLNIHVNGADSSLSYIVVMTAVDSAGSESPYSAPFTVFAIAAPSAVNDLVIQIVGTDYILTWTAVPNGAKYVIETSDSPDGPWTPFAQTYDTSFRRTIGDPGTKLFFLVIAER